MRRSALNNFTLSIYSHLSNCRGSYWFLTCLVNDEYFYYEAIPPSTEWSRAYVTAAAEGLKFFYYCPCHMRIYNTVFVPYSYCARPLPVPKKRKKNPRFVRLNISVLLLFRVEEYLPTLRGVLWYPCTGMHSTDTVRIRCGHLRNGQVLKDL